MHATSELSIKKKRKRTAGREIEEAIEKKKKKNKQYQPNYFISLPITNPKVIFFVILIWYKLLQQLHVFMRRTVFDTVQNIFFSGISKETLAVYSMSNGMLCNVFCE